MSPIPLSDTLQLEALKKGDERETRPQATVVVVQGSEADLGAHARIDRRTVIGRDPAAELTLNDPGASKQHACIELTEEDGEITYHLHDLGSTNGTEVNGKKVKGTFPLRDSDKISIAGTVLRFVLADEIDAAFHAQVDAMLSTDDLTGLLAYRRFDAALEDALKLAKAKNTPLTLLVLDLDGLKGINDVHGHATGAFTIGQVGRLLASVLGKRGIATRFGGDEFVAFLPGLGREAATQLAEEIRQRVASAQFTREGVTVKVTVSIGVASFPERAQDAKKLFDAADRALYRAKARGKNQVAS